jgi:AcrR family transcriptional regulator
MPKIINKKEKKQKILQAAIKEFASKGFKATKISSIAESADIGKGTIYEYFKSKDELFHNAFIFFRDEINTTIAKKIYNIFDPVKKLNSFFNAWIELLDSPLCDFMEVILDFWAEGIKNEHKNTNIDLKTMYQEYRLMTQNLLDDCMIENKSQKINTHLTSSIIIGTLDGLMLQWIVDRNAFDLKSAIQSLGNLIMDKIKC